MTTPTPPTSPAATDPVERVSRALDEIRAGRMVILVDDEDRENEGDLVMAADRVTPEAINFMATHARGLICLPMADELIDRLELPMMVRDNRAPLGTAFTVSIEARQGVTTGISAARPRPHHPAPPSPTAQPGRPGDARPRLPAARQARRRAEAGRPDRGLGRSRAPGRPQPPPASSARS